MTVMFALYRGKGQWWRDGIIRLLTRSVYSHVELVMLSYVTPHQSTPCITASKRDGKKVRIKDIDLFSGSWDILHIPDLQLAECNLRAEQHLGHVYDTCGAVRSVTPFPRSKPGMTWCSHLMGKIIGYDFAYTLTPQEFVEHALWDLGGWIVTHDELRTGEPV